VTRTPLALAALASVAVPGLDPATVEGVAQLNGHQFEVAFVEDTQRRRWVVRAPISAAAGAQMDVSVSLLGLFARRLPFAVPAPKGFVALGQGGRAAVYPYIVGRPLDFAHLPAGPGIAAELGRALAALHNLDLTLCEDAGLTSYDPDTYRTRRLADLDRAAATGYVPAGLLSRWERALEDVSLWRFAPTPTHGDLSGHEVLAVFSDEGDAATGRVRGLTGWENAKIADPADDFATLVTQASPEAFDSVLEAYAHARVDRPDKYLERRARLAGELRLVTELLTAVGSKDPGGIKACARKLQQLNADSLDEVEDEPVMPTAPTSRHFSVQHLDSSANGDGTAREHTGSNVHLNADLPKTGVQPNTAATTNDGSAEDVSAKNGSADDVSAKNGSADDVSAKNGSADDVSAKNGSADDVSAKPGSAENRSTEDVSAEDVSAEDVSSSASTTSR
jgi:aminoglycoside phosphotransferase (APT) family kinase protein